MIKELRNKSNKELGETILSKKSELLEYRFQQANGQFEKMHKMKIVRKIIAMSFTILKERNVDFYISCHNGILVEYKNGQKNITTIKYDFQAKKNEIQEKKVSNDKTLKNINQDDKKLFANTKNVSKVIKTHDKKTTTKVVKTTGNRGV